MRLFRSLNFGLCCKVLTFCDYKIPDRPLPVKRRTGQRSLPVFVRIAEFQKVFPIMLTNDLVILYNVCVGHLERRVHSRRFVLLLGALCAIVEA